MVPPPATNDPIDDPFAPQDGSRTFIRPTPGGRGSARPAPPIESGRAVDAAADLPSTDHGLNPLLALANRLLLAVPQIRATRQLADPAELRNTLAHGLRQFSTDAAARQISPDQITAARYVLCTVLDEAASDTPWGGSGVWAGYSLLVMFHNENYGGEKVFRLMARLAEDPARNRDLLELIHAALSLGFEGRYRIIDNGAAQLEAVRDKLAQILRQQRGDHPAALAQHWQVPPQRRRRSLGWLPLLVAASVVALVLLVLHWGLASALGDQSDPVFAQIQGLRLAPTAAATTRPPRPAEPAAQPRLAQFLQPDIQANRVAVRDEADRSIVTLRGDGLFAPGSTTLSGDAEALLARIGDALVQVKGAVLVTGHTDSQPIRSARFPSNWHLSDARARAVGELLLTRRLAPERLRTEGLADASPVAPNDTPTNRALNRRVEITLLVGASQPQAARPASSTTPLPNGASGSL
jgi:type VI secretion system protein ImpK